MKIQLLSIIELLVTSSVLVHGVQPVVLDFAVPQRQCQPIRIKMCRGIGYNETAMPNLVGHEIQSEVEYTLETFAPLIQYVCSSQLKLFLCATYVPMCTPKTQDPIGPCRSLCESVRSRCHPVLQGFGFPWPPALDCNQFPRQNNEETMCMEGPGEEHSPIQDNEYYAGVASGSKNSFNSAPAFLDCPGIGKSHLYVKLPRSGRCVPLCEADILFDQHEKHLTEVWVATWTYAALGLAIIATLCIIFSTDTKHSPKWASMLTPLVWCHNMVAAGWTIRFVSGRIAASCGYDPQQPNISLLLSDGLSNASCASTFILRYYFSMAAYIWWAILCLGWHRDVRRSSPDSNTGHVALTVSTYASSVNSDNNKRSRACIAKRNYNITQSNMARFTAWFLPAVQTVVVIIARLVDADELLGACFVGNQSDKGLQILVATPLFCYWIFGSVNLISGYLVHRRNKKVSRNLASQMLPHQLQMSGIANSGIGTFLFIYCVPCALLLMAVIYEFINIDIWLNVPLYVTATEGITTPMWPFLTRAFMELMLGIICCSWILGPRISTIYKRQITPSQLKHSINTPAMVKLNPHNNMSNARTPNSTNSTVSYHTVRQSSVMPSPSKHRPIRGMSPAQMHSYSKTRTKYSSVSPLSTQSTERTERIYMNQSGHKHIPQYNRSGNETVF